MLFAIGARQCCVPQAPGNAVCHRRNNAAGWSRRHSESMPRASDSESVETSPTHTQSGMHGHWQPPLTLACRLRSVQPLLIFAAASSAAWSIIIAVVHALSIVAARSVPQFSTSWLPGSAGRC